MKIIMSVVLGLAVTSASAGNWYAAGELDTAENRNTHSETIGTSVIIGYKEGAWQYSSKISTSQAEWGTGSISNTYEGRVKRSVSMYGLKPYIQGRLGEKVSSTTNFPYYAFDAGIVVSVANSVDIDFSYRYRNAFDAGDNYQTDRYGIEGKYKLNLRDTVGLRYAQMYGDTEVDSWRLQYARSF